MRRFAAVLLGIACLAALPTPKGTASDPKQVENDEKKLKAAKLAVDTPALLALLRARTLNEEDRSKVEVLIAQLGAMSFRTREQATQSLIDKGAAVVELLKNHVADPDPEIARRAEKCIEKIKEADLPSDVPAAVVRLLAARKAGGTVATLLAFLPFADSDATGDEVRAALATLAVQDGKVDQTLVTGLKDKHPQCRAAAGEALTQAGARETQAEVVALLKDSSPLVRLRVARSLVLAKNREAVPVLIDAVVDANQDQAWQIEDILCRLCDGKSLPPVSLDSDAAARKKYRDAWQAWWNEHGKNVDLAVLHQATKFLGYTTIVLLDDNRILELDPDSKVRWRIDGVGFPLDVQVLPGNKVLIAEYKANRVTERSFKGEILWQYDYPPGGGINEGPQMAQRLPNRNTLIAGKYQLVEIDPAGKRVFEYNVPGGEGIMKCSKVSANEIVILYQDGVNSGRVVRIDAAGKELSGFKIPLSNPVYGGRIQGLPNGNILVPHHGENRVVEYEPNGKEVWRIAVDHPIVATRLPDGHTIVTSGEVGMVGMAKSRAVEFDANGKEVWEYGNKHSRVTRAVRR
jgi:HEAT repeat protein